MLYSDIMKIVTKMVARHEQTQLYMFYIRIL